MCLVEVVVVQKEGLGREEGTYQSERPGEGLHISSQGLIRNPVRRAGNRSVLGSPGCWSQQLGMGRARLPASLLH